jgi:hypothetical protein
MLYADKKHLETETARDVLRVREKEMRYYARNLSMLATQSALLAGFAFTILSQYTFKFPYQGVLSCARRADLMMSLDERCDPLRGGNPELPGMSGWTWDTWLHQFGQLLNLTCTTYAMALQLWTLTRCVLTNILGLGLALRGPEGSMDRAVRHMARENSLALNQFAYGTAVAAATLPPPPPTTTTSRATASRRHQDLLRCDYHLFSERLRHLRLRDHGVRHGVDAEEDAPRDDRARADVLARRRLDGHGAVQLEG